MSTDDNDEKTSATTEEFELFLRLSSGTRLRLQGLRAGDTVRTVKDKISSLLPDTPSDQQRVIYKGRILDDKQVLSYYGIVHQSTLFLVASNKGKGSESSGAPAIMGSKVIASGETASAPATVPPSQASVAVSPSQHAVSPPSSAASLRPSMSASSDWMAQIARQQQMMAEDPASAQQLLNSPLMQRLLDNPDFITNLLQSQLESNPALQRMMDENPSLRHMLGDPAALQQAAELLRNPAALQQAMRQQDLALSQLENMPGGFAALSNMYRNVQAPLEESLTEQAQESRRQEAEVSARRREDLGATGTAMPNPWGPSSSSRTTTAGAEPFPTHPSAALDLSSLLRGMNAPVTGSSASTRTTTASRSSSNTNPWANLGGASGTASTAPAGSATASAFASSTNGSASFPGNNGAANSWELMMQDFSSSSNNNNSNPMSQQSMLNMLESPMMRTLTQQMQEHPEQFRSLFEADPTFRTMFGNNPEAGDRFIQTVMNPETLRNMMLLQQQMGGSFPPVFPPPEGQSQQLPDWGRFMSGVPQGSPNPWGGGGSSGGGGLDFSSLFRGASTPQPPPPPPPHEPRERYRRQLQQLAEMSFYDEEACLAALQAEHGNLNRAIDRLLSTPPPPPPSSSSSQPATAATSTTPAPAAAEAADAMDLGSTSSDDNANNEPTAAPPAQPPKDAVDKKND